MCTSPQDDVCQGELLFSIDDKGGENVVGIGVMIAGGLLVLPSMTKGEIVDQWLSLMLTQATLEATQILHGHFDLTTYSIMSQGSSIWILLIDMFPLIYGTPRNSSWFERYSCLKLVALVSGLNPYGVVAWHS